MAAGTRCSRPPIWEDVPPSNLIDDEDIVITLCDPCHEETDIPKFGGARSNWQHSLPPPRSWEANQGVPSHGRDAVVIFIGI